MEVHSGDVEGPRKGQRAEWLERSKMEGKGKEKRSRPPARPADSSWRRACLTLRRGWRVSRHHMHRTHSSEARLMMQNVITAGATIITVRIPMSGFKRRTRRSAAVPLRSRSYNLLIALVAWRGLAPRTAGRVRALQLDRFVRRGIIGGAANVCF